MVPISFANCLRNSPSAGSSGMITMRGFVDGTPAARASDACTSAAPGCVPDVWSCAIFAGQRSRHISGSIRSGCLWSDRNV